MILEIALDETPLREVAIDPNPLVTLVAILDENPPEAIADATLLPAPNT